MIEVPCKIIKVIHDDSNEEIEHKKAAEKYEADEEEIGHIGSTGLIRIQHFT